MPIANRCFACAAATFGTVLGFQVSAVLGHGSAVSPSSRVYNVFQANPENPNFELAANAINQDSKSAYYTWNQVSQNIPEAVQQGLPAGFDYSPWVPDGQLASGGRVDPDVFGSLTYRGLDQVSADWPTTPVAAGENILVDFYATAVHEPSVWDVWMTTPEWTPASALTWSQMEFLGRPTPELSGNNYTFDLTIPADRSGHHVLWIAWQRDDPVGEVFFSTSDLFVSPTVALAGDYNGDTFVNAADYAVWRDDPADGTRTYGEWSAAFGGVQPVLAVTVPEPSAATAFWAFIFLTIARGGRLLRCGSV